MKEEKEGKKNEHQRKMQLFSIPLPNHPRHRALTRTDLTVLHRAWARARLLLSSVRVCARLREERRGDGRVGSAHEGIPRTGDVLMGWDCQARTPAAAPETHLCSLAAVTQCLTPASRTARLPHPGASPALPPPPPSRPPPPPPSSHGAPPLDPKRCHLSASAHLRSSPPLLAISLSLSPSLPPHPPSSPLFCRFSALPASLRWELRVLEPADCGARASASVCLLKKMLVRAEEEGGRAQSAGILPFLTSLRGLEGSFWVWRIGVKTIAVCGWVVGLLCGRAASC